METKTQRLLFDLNSDIVLAHWTKIDALRELYANAIDEQTFTKSENIETTQIEKNTFIIRDYGRGIEYKHLTLNENKEKLDSKKAIGQFGFGLKDAIATLYRHNVKVSIRSRHSHITFEKSAKNNFDDVITLHALISQTHDANFVGTEICLEGIKEEEVMAAQNLFLKFKSPPLLETTTYGDVYQKEDAHTAKIYINGVVAAYEDNMLFDYNITNITKVIRDALNRERKNVSRSAYGNSIRTILKACHSEEIMEILYTELIAYSKGSIYDEMKWIDIQEHIAIQLHEDDQVAFVTAEEIRHHTDLIEQIENTGHEVVTISKELAVKLEKENERRYEKNPLTNNLINTFERKTQQKQESYSFEFVDEADLTSQEQKIWVLKDAIIQMLAPLPNCVNGIYISTTMEKSDSPFKGTRGVWRPSYGQIIIKRDVLNTSAQEFIGVLLHELAHAYSGASDATRDFENELTRMLGIIGVKAVEHMFEYK